MAALRRFPGATGARIELTPTECAADRSWPVGSTKQNDLGLFDMHGNVWYWCQERYEDYGQGGSRFEDSDDLLSIDDKDSRVLRGGSLINLARFVRSALRMKDKPASHAEDFGFRPARTFAP